LILRVFLLVVAERLAKTITKTLPLPFTTMAKTSPKAIPEWGGGFFTSTLFFLWQSSFKDIIRYLAKNRFKII